MATSLHLTNAVHRGWSPPIPINHNFTFSFSERFRCCIKRNPSRRYRVSLLSTRRCYMGIADSLNIEPPSPSIAAVSSDTVDVLEVARNIKLDEGTDISGATLNLIQRIPLAYLDPATAKLAIGIIGPLLSAFSFLFILRVVMSWYPKLPLGKFPYVIVYSPTEPFLVPTRKLIPPLAGVDITPIVWVGLVNFLSEILVGPQGLLVLVSQQVS